MTRWYGNFSYSDVHTANINDSRPGQALRFRTRKGMSLAKLALNHQLKASIQYHGRIAQYYLINNHHAEADFVNS